jgi:AcrR family transcriptional regulator
MNKKAEKIIQQVSQLYLKYGIKSVTMDDVARELGVSKKTLYEHFKDKADLVRKFILYSIENIETKFNQATSKKLNAIDTLIEISKMITSFLGEFNPSICYDLQKYYPSIWKMIIDYKRDRVSANVYKNLQKGIKEGLYRNDINPEIIAKIYVSRIEASMNPDNKFSNEVHSTLLYNELMKYHIRGIASTEGIEYFEKIVIKNLV